MFKHQFSSALLRLLCLVAFALCFGGVAHAQTPTVINLEAVGTTVEGGFQRFRVTLSRPATQALTISFFTSPNGGDTGARSLPEGPFEADYTSVGTDRTFAVNQSEIFIDVQTTSDQTFEFDETFTGFITNARFNGQPANNVVFGNNTATGTIVNNDNPPTVSLLAPTDPILEGDSNNLQRQNAIFTLDINPIAERPLNLALTTTDGSATSQGPNADYVGVTNDPVVVPAGTSQQPYNVVILGDDLYEGDEGFSLTVNYSPTLAGTASSTVMAIIQDNDLPTYVIDSSGANVTEGTPARFRISLLDRQGRPVSALTRIDFSYALQNGSATFGPTGANPTVFDYQDNNPDPFTQFKDGTFTILPGQRDFTLVIDTVDDNIQEQLETFNLVINSASNTIAATPGSNIGRAVITDNDSAPVITVTNASATEGTGNLPGDRNSVTFTVNLTSVTSTPVTVDYQTVPQTATTGIADPNTDYVPTTGRVTFGANQATQTFSIPIIPDSVNEPDETFQVRLFNPGNATFANNAPQIVVTGTIIDDDSAGTVSVAAQSVDVAENVQGGIVNVLVNFMPNGVPSRPVTVDFTTIPGTAVQAGQRDYFGKTGRLTFQPRAGNSQLAIPIEIINDNIREGNETFIVRLTAVNGATLSTNAAETTVTITDNELLPLVRIAPANARFAEDAGRQNFTVFLLSRSQSPVTINYAFVDGTATNGTDYTGANGVITFQPGGDTAIPIPYSIDEDQIAEGNENFTLQLTADVGDDPANPSPANFRFENDRSSATVTIVDNDLTPELTISDAQIAEGSDGDIDTGAVLTFNVSLNRASARDISFTYSTLNLRQPNCLPANGCDVASNDDYQSVRNVRFTIPAGETAGTIMVRVAPDALNEFREQFAVVARDLVNTVPSVTRTVVPGRADDVSFGSVAYGNIINDDAGGAITLAGPFGEGTTPSGNLIEGYQRGGGTRVGDAASFVLTLPAPAGRVVTVDYTITGTVSPRDFVDLTTGQGPIGFSEDGTRLLGRVSFFPGSTTRTITLRAAEDRLDEGLESLILNVSINDNNGLNSFTIGGANSNARTNIEDRTPGLASITPSVGFPAFGNTAASRLTISGNQLRTDGNPRVSALVFTGGATVEGGGLQYLSDNSLIVNVPTPPRGSSQTVKTGPISLRLFDGSVLTLPLVDNAQPRFVLQPVIDSFTPATGVARATVITITGRNFRDTNNPVTAVRFNGAQVNVAQDGSTDETLARVISDTQIQVRVPAAATNGALNIVTRDGGTGPASETALTVTRATAGGLGFGPNPDTSTIVEDSGGGNISRPALNFDGADNNTPHRAYQVFLNPARQDGGPNSGAAIRPTKPVKLRFAITDSTSTGGAGNVAPLIAVRADLTNAGRPTFLQNSGADGIVEVTVPAGYNTDNPFEVVITYAGKDTLPPIVGGGASASVTLRASIFGADDDEILFPNTRSGNELRITIGRREIVNSSNQTAIAFTPGSTNNFSVPFSTNSTGSVAQTEVFNTAPGPNTYTVYRFDASNQRNNRTNGADFQALALGDRLQRGVGYRLVTAPNANVQLKTRGAGLVAGNEGSFSLNLTRNIPFAATASNAANSSNGYNFIGFPFDGTQVSRVNFRNSTFVFNGTSRSFAQAVAAGLINSQLFTVDGNGNLTAVSADTPIEPFQAYFVQVFRDNITLVLDNPTR